MSEITKENHDNGKSNTIIVLLLERMGYVVKDTSGKTNFFYNVFEFFVQLMYFGLSLYNAIKLFYSPSTVSVTVWVINILVLSKIWAKNMKEARKLNPANPNIRELESFCGVVMTQAIVYKRKIYTINVMLAISTSLILYSLFWGYTSTVDPKAVVGIIVAVTSFLDGILNILENMYQAEPKTMNVLTMRN